MYLSRLTLNPICRHVQADLASPYQMHKTVLRAFPTAEEGGPGRVLFRVEQTRDEFDDSIPVVLVQSEKAPDWSRLTSVPELGGYTVREVEQKEFAPYLRAGQRLAFRLRANPTVKREGKRHGLFVEEQQASWLNRKAETSGFRVLACRTIPGPTNQDRIGGNGRSRRQAVFLAVRFEGVLEVIDPTRFQSTLKSGIGSAKAFGFGLLSVAPVHVD